MSEKRFEDWVDLVEKELRARMFAIRDTWEPAEVAEIMNALGKPGVRGLFDADYVPSAAATFCTDVGPANHLFKDCKDRQYRGLEKQRRRKFKRARRAWGRG